MFHEVSPEHGVLSRVGHPAARGLHCIHASLWIIACVLPGRCASPSMVLSPKSSTTFFRRTTATACVNGRSGCKRLGAPPCADNGERPQLPIFRNREHVSKNKTMNVLNTGKTNKVMKVAPDITG